MVGFSFGVWGFRVGFLLGFSSFPAEADRSNKEALFPKHKPKRTRKPEALKGTYTVPYLLLNPNSLGFRG